MKVERNGERLVIASALRTPIGQAGKSLAEFDSHELGDMVIAELFKRSKLDPAQVDGVVTGEIGQNSRAPNAARVMSVRAGIPLSATAITVANNCVSGYEAVNEAARRILLGENELILVTGQESMSNFAFYIDRARRNPKTGNLEKLLKVWNELPDREEYRIVDAMVEGLTDPARNAMMIETGEVVAQQLGLTKEQLDSYAHSSYKKAYDAITTGKYDPFYIPVKHTKGVLEKDEYIMSKSGFVEKPERFAKAGAIYEMAEMGGMENFYKKYGKYIGRDFDAEKSRGAVSLFNACPQSDGAGACFVTTESKAHELGLEVQAIIKAWANIGVDPVIMGLGIAHAMNKLVQENDVSWDDIHNFEVHEAFAATAYGSMQLVRDKFGYDLVARLEKGDVNPNGGTLALGHPLGATGVRMVINQIMGLQANSENRYSLGAICAGGGVGGALLLEKP